MESWSQGQTRMYLEIWMNNMLNASRQPEQGEQYTNLEPGLGKILDWAWIWWLNLVGSWGLDGLKLKRQ